MRAARRMAEKVGYDPDTGCHLDQAPQSKQEDASSLEDGKTGSFRDHLTTAMFNAREICHVWRSNFTYF